eukprot:TRINITY_DN29144_c0_g1_i1.p1 TRINITY_DN29144_c0_g1~~TRINITY_DN29144_c0_g1_i1.p1  ORF type:complete len:477 (+),score=41.13 TRINITY_DN29144_c0_g1_i1:224-1654(+)
MSCEAVPLLASAMAACVSTVNQQEEETCEECVSLFNNDNRSGSCRIRIPRRKNPNSSGRENDTMLYRFQRMLRFAGVAHPTTLLHITVAWILFIFFTFLLPAAAVLFLSWHCPEKQKHGECAKKQEQLHCVVQLSESSLAVISFVFLSHNMKKHGLRKMLFSKNEHERPKIRLAFRKQMKASLRLLACIGCPCLIAKSLYEIRWYRQVSLEIPFLGEKEVYHIVLTFALLISWLYRTSLFLFVCTLFRLVCTLQLIKFGKFEKHYKKGRDISSILVEHMHIRQQLLKISHRYRVFILSSLIAITASQIASLFIATAHSSDIDIIKAGNLLVCAAVQVTGFVLCLHGAARITHRAQGTVSRVSVWHALETCRSNNGCFSRSIDVNVSQVIEVDQLYVSSSDEDSTSTESTNDFSTAGSSNFESTPFQKRQALVSYLRHSNAGISIYGFVLDRGFIYTLFALELSMVLFILGLTVALD